MSDPVYCYPPDFIVLKNKLDIRDAAELEAAERLYVVQRTQHSVPTGDFDLDHLKSIHRHLFQDVYEWAGELRTVEIAKGAQQFQFRRFIETGMANVHSRIIESGYFIGLNAHDFALKTGEIIGDVNYVHPFREGNGRTQLQFLKQLATRAGHQLDLAALDPETWIAASQAAHGGDYQPMAACIEAALRV